MAVTLAETGVDRGVRRDGDDHHQRYRVVGEPPAGQRAHDPEPTRTRVPGTAGATGASRGTAPARPARRGSSTSGPRRCGSPRPTSTGTTTTAAPAGPRPGPTPSSTPTDGTTWTPVTLDRGSTYADGAGHQHLQPLHFEPITTSRADPHLGRAGQRRRHRRAALARQRRDSRLGALAGADPYRRGPGARPAGDARRGATAAAPAAPSAFTWQQITPEMVEEANVDPFVVYGTNDGYGLIAEARIYVRPETAQGGISIQGAETFEQTVEVGELPYLPTKVEVSYNDGSRDNQAIGVDWHFDENIVNTPGRYTIIGDLVLPDYVSEAGTTRTTLTLTVGEPARDRRRTGRGPPAGASAATPTSRSTPQRRATCRSRSSWSRRTGRVPSPTWPRKVRLPGVQPRADIGPGRDGDGEGHRNRRRRAVTVPSSGTVRRAQRPPASALPWRPASSVHRRRHHHP